MFRARWFEPRPITLYDTCKANTNTKKKENWKDQTNIKHIKCFGNFCQGQSLCITHKKPINNEQQQANKQTNLKHIKCFDDLCQGQSPAKAPTVPAFYLCTPHSAQAPSSWSSSSSWSWSSSSSSSLSCHRNHHHQAWGQRLFCMLCFYPELRSLLMCLLLCLRPPHDIFYTRNTGFSFEKTLAISSAQMKGSSYLKEKRMVRNLEWKIHIMLCSIFAQLRSHNCPAQQST